MSSDFPEILRMVAGVVWQAMGMTKLGVACQTFRTSLRPSVFLTFSVIVNTGPGHFGGQTLGHFVPGLRLLHATYKNTTMKFTNVPRHSPGFPGSHFL